MLPSLLTASAALLISFASLSVSTNCNNSPDLCDRNYNNITHMGIHDGAFLRDKSTSFSTSGNQFYNATVALSAGIRLIQAQVHNLNGSLELCHTSCSLLDGGTLQTFLSGIRTWMDDNPNEIVTLLLVNSDNESTATFGSAFTESEISKYGYTPSSTSGPILTWPTLQTLITADTRLITFVASITYDSTYPYLLAEFDFVFETAFGVSFPDFNCTLDRPTSLSSSTSAIASGYMGVLNHFADTVEGFGITVPDVSNITTTNSPETNTTGSLGTHGAQCESEWGTKPNFILVDFFNVGPAIDTADRLNGITAVGRTNVSTAQLSSTSDGLVTKGLGWAQVTMIATGVLFAVAI